MGVVKLSTAGIRNYSKTSDFLSGNAPLSLGAFDLLQTTTLSTSASSITFSGLGAYSDYKHLQIRVLTRTDRVANSTLTRLQFNSDSGNNYAQHTLRGDGSSVVSDGGGNVSGISRMYSTGSNSPAGAFFAASIDVLDFSNTSKYKTLRMLGGHAQNENIIMLSSGLWRNLTAITSITFSDFFSTNFVAGTRMSLYGVK